MKLTQSEKITLITVLGAVVASAIIHIGIREWYAPDIRYEEGSYYISGQTAVTSLKLKNHGHSDAEDIIVNVEFNGPLAEISIDDPSTTFVNISGGKGEKCVSGKIPRLVPGQEVFVYFAIDNHSLKLRKNFLSQLTFKGGKGKTGEPIWLFLFTMGLIALGYAVLILFLWRFEKRKFPRHYDRIGDVIKLANTAISQAIPRDDFESSLKQYLADVRFRKETLQTIALKLFDSQKAENDGE